MFCMELSRQNLTMMSSSSFLAMSGTVAVVAAWPTGSSISSFSLAGRPNRDLNKEPIVFYANTEQLGGGTLCVFPRKSLKDPEK